MDHTDNKPRFSIIVAIHNQAKEAEACLPVLLSQQYEPGYEVIVVDESSTDETADLLKQLKANHPHLYTTFLPKYQFQKNKQRLALTIGVKAAKYEWLIFADVNTPPASPLWLEELAGAVCHPTVLTLGYASRKNGDVSLQTFSSVAQARFIVSTTERSKGKGHSGRYLRYLRGKYDFLVVRTEYGHDTLRLFECPLRGGSLLARQMRVMAHNLSH